LAIVQRITEQHGGTLQLADAPRRNGKVQGASVRMDLPIREMDEVSTTIEASAGNGARRETKTPEAAE
jgi:two-component system nitrogen regulation sensor histidine kinase NtrY